VSDFFEPPPPPPEQKEYHPPPWLAPPANVLGGPVPLRLIVARREAVAIAVMNARAYPTGLEFTVSVRRPRGRSALEEPPFGCRRVSRDEIEPEVLRFGVQFSDGRKATSLGGFTRPPDQEPPGPVLVMRGGGGGGGQWDHGFWLYPLPPPGTLAFVCEWPSEGIELTRLEIDAELVREAAKDAEMLWEEAEPRRVT
jgi:hypothetical protein